MLYINNHINRYTEADIERLMEQLPEWRRSQAMRFRHFEGRRQSVLAYMELCRGLSEEYGLSEAPEFLYDEHGKPTLVAYPHIHFSLSHCRQAVGCLLSSAPCGLDIETVRPLRESLMRHCMNETEQTQILSAEEPAVAFTRLWTQKEAVLKLLGTGLAGGLKDALENLNVRGIALHTEFCLGHSVLLSTALCGIDSTNSECQIRQIAEF